MDDLRPALEALAAYRARVTDAERIRLHLLSLVPRDADSSASCANWCIWWLRLAGSLGLDFGVCVNPQSERCALLCTGDLGCPLFDDGPSQEDK